MVFWLEPNCYPRRILQLTPTLSNQEVGRAINRTGLEMEPLKREASFVTGASSSVSAALRQWCWGYTQGQMYGPYPRGHMLLRVEATTDRQNRDGSRVKVSKGNSRESGASWQQKEIDVAPPWSFSVLLPSPVCSRPKQTKALWLLLAPPEAHTFFSQPSLQGQYAFLHLVKTLQLQPPKPQAKFKNRGIVLRQATAQEAVLCPT